MNFTPNNDTEGFLPPLSLEANYLPRMVEENENEGKMVSLHFSLTQHRCMNLAHSLSEHPGGLTTKYFQYIEVARMLTYI